jgi:hypothetical protein
VLAEVGGQGECSKVHGLLFSCCWVWWSGGGGGGGEPRCGPPPGLPWPRGDGQGPF